MIIVYGLVGLVGLVVGLIIIGIAYEQISAFIARRRYKTPLGDLIDIGTHRLHIHTMGERQARQPAIVFDSGVGSNSLDWQRVQPALAKHAQTITYDRSGYGWSDESTLPRTPQRIIEELHQLLTNAGIEPPYVLVGHSFGGLHVRLFAETYPDEVVGIVLVDSSHPEMIAERNTAPEIRRLKNVQLFQFFGLVRAMLPRILTRANDLDPEARRQYLAMTLMDNANIINEAVPLFTNGVDLTDAIDMPLIVVSRHVDDALESEKRWASYQEKLLDLSPTAKHIHSEKSKHWIALAEPDVVVNAVLQILNDIQNTNHPIESKIETEQEG